MPSITASTSAPTPSQRAAMALIYEIFVARNAFAAYLMVSADAGSVITQGALNELYISATLWLA